MEEGSDRWAPPVGDSGTRDPLVGGRREGENAGAGGEAGPRLAARWAEGKNRGERFWAFGPISTEREEEKNKYFSNFIFRPLLN
jgi:hypothetical protein